LIEDPSTPGKLLADAIWCWRANYAQHHAAGASRFRQEYRARAHAMSGARRRHRNRVSVVEGTRACFRESRVRQAERAHAFYARDRAARAYYRLPLALAPLSLNHPLLKDNEPRVAGVALVDIPSAGGEAALISVLAKVLVDLCGVRPSAGNIVTLPVQYVEVA
jgi:hypothetical protein